jgi:hypothetical protein
VPPRGLPERLVREELGDLERVVGQRLQPLGERVEALRVQLAHDNLLEGATQPVASAFYFTK